MSTFFNTRGGRTFLLVWLGQLVSLIGSRLTSFGLGVWVYQRTGSATDFAVIAVVALLPGVLISPLAGVIVDRYDRRKIMLLSDLCAALATVFVALMLAANRLELWHIYLQAFVASAASAFQLPAYTASTTLMVDKANYGRVAGMVSIADGLARVIGPLLAGVLITQIGLAGIIAIDFATFLFAVSVLAFVRFPSLPRQLAQAANGAKSSMLHDLRVGWRFLAQRRGLLGLVLYFTALNFFGALSDVVLTPMVLSFSEPEGLGIVTAAFGAGMIIGSVIMGVWGGPQRKMRVVYGFGIWYGVLMMASGFRADVLLIGVCMFLIMIGTPIINGSMRTLLQQKIPPEIQGRVFSTLFMFVTGAMPIAYLLGAQLADHTFEPLLMPDGALASTVGQVIGVGAGRGMAFLFIVAGVCLLLFTLGAYLYPPIRNVERDLPDYDETAPPAIPPSAVTVEEHQVTTLQPAAST